MKGWKNSIVLLILLIAPISESLGQYHFLLKGERNPFDSAVAVRIDRYRAEGRKLQMADKLIDSLEWELYFITDNNLLKDSLISDLSSQVQKQKVTIERKDNVISSLDDNFDKLFNAVDKQKGILNRREFWFGVGVLGTLLLTR